MALATCRECRAQVSTEASSCPHCGVPNPATPTAGDPASGAKDEPGEQRPPAKPKRGAFIAVLVVGGLVWLVIVSISSRSATTSTTTPARRQLAPLVGTDCTVSNMAPMAAEAGTAYEVARALAKKDEPDVMALLASGKVTPIEGGGRARVLEADWTKDALKVRMTSGRFLGREGWLYEGMCPP